MEEDLVYHIIGASLVVFMIGITIVYEQLPRCAGTSWKKIIVLVPILVCILIILAYMYRTYTLLRWKSDLQTPEEKQAYLSVSRWSFYSGLVICLVVSILMMVYFSYTIGGIYMGLHPSSSLSKGPYTRIMTGFRPSVIRNVLSEIRTSCEQTKERQRQRSQSSLSLESNQYKLSRRVSSGTTPKSRPSSSSVVMDKYRVSSSSSIPSSSKYRHGTSLSDIHSHPNKSSDKYTIDRIMEEQENDFDQI